jgi:integrase
MPRIKLTAAAIERVRAPVRGQVDYFDAAFPALALRVTARGVRSWVYFGRVHGKMKRATLGRYPTLTLAKARQKAGETADAMRQGVDPAAAKRAARKAVHDSFEAVADEWLKRDQAHNRSYAEVKRIIERDVLPAWQGRLISSITRRDVLELIDAVADRGAATMARRLHAHLHRLFRWCVGRGILEANPMADSPKPGADVKRDRTLSDGEIALIWKASGELGWPFGPAFRLLVLTGARREEIGALRWVEIDGNTIRLKGERTKNGEPHDIPLCASAIELLDGLPRIADSEFVFTTTGDTPVSGWSRAKELLDKAIAEANDGHSLPDWRIHDLRRTLATGLQRLGFNLQTIEAVLGHVGGTRTGVVGVYQRHGFEPEKRAALEAWAHHVAGVVSGKPAKIIAMRARTRR